MKSGMALKPGIFAICLSLVLTVSAIAQEKTAGASPQSTADKVKPESAAGLTLEPCAIAVFDAQGKCGKLEVFENREKRSGRKIALNVLVLPSQAADKKPDPIFFLVGGPGAGAAVMAKIGGQKDLINRFRRDRDVVFVDQRGTGDSNPLRCNLLGDPDKMQGYFDDTRGVDKVAACRAELEKNADLTLYTTSIAMDDLDDVRRALGYTTINLYGGSYGSTAALEYLRRHEKQVRSVTIEGVAPPDYRLPLPIAKGFQHSIERLFSDCAADERCHQAFPDIKKDFESTVDTLAKGPIPAQTVNPISRQPEQVIISRYGYIDTVRLMLYSREFRNLLPLLINQTAAKNFGGFAALGFLDRHGLEAALDRGMGFSVICSESIPFIKDEDVKREMDGTYYGDSLMRSYAGACPQWPKAEVPATFPTPVKSNVPVLMISGEVDPVTPPWIGREAAKYLPNSRQIIGRNWSHDSDN